MYNHTLNHESTEIEQSKQSNLGQYIIPHMLPVSVKSKL